MELFFSFRIKLEPFSTAKCTRSHMYGNSDGMIFNYRDIQLKFNVIYTHSDCVRFSKRLSEHKLSCPSAKSNEAHNTFLVNLYLAKDKFLYINNGTFTHIRMLTSNKK